VADSAKKAEIIVVDDEEHLRDLVAEYLAGQGFGARAASGGRALDAMLAEKSADLILLDINMPEEDGFSIARRLRARTAIPLIMLTAVDDVIDRVVGLEVGADDYLTKPFDLRELKARIRAVLRRGQPQPPAGPAASSMSDAADPATGRAALVPFGKLFVDRDGRRLLTADGQEEPVTAMEFELIEVFLENPYRVLSRERLLDLARRKNDDPFDRSVDIRVTRLRKKIEADPSKPQTIKTVRGAGYLYSPTSKAT
jgi:DNA-binding response OmpR family regulator